MQLSEWGFDSKLRQRLQLVNLHSKQQQQQNQQQQEEEEGKEKVEIVVETSIDCNDIDAVCPKNNITHPPQIMKATVAVNVKRWDEQLSEQSMKLFDWSPFKMPLPGAVHIRPAIHAFYSQLHITTTTTTATTPSNTPTTSDMNINSSSPSHVHIHEEEESTVVMEVQRMEHLELIKNIEIHRHVLDYLLPKFNQEFLLHGDNDNQKQRSTTNCKNNNNNDNNSMNNDQWQQSSSHSNSKSQSSYETNNPDSHSDLHRQPPTSHDSTYHHHHHHNQSEHTHSSTRSNQQTSDKHSHKRKAKTTDNTHTTSSKKNYEYQYADAEYETVSHLHSSYAHSNNNVMSHKRTRNIILTHIKKHLIHSYQLIRQVAERIHLVYERLICSLRPPWFYAFTTYNYYYMTQRGVCRQYVVDDVDSMPHKDEIIRNHTHTMKKKEHESMTSTTTANYNSDNADLSADKVPTDSVYESYSKSHSNVDDKEDQISKPLYDYDDEINEGMRVSGIDYIKTHVSDYLRHQQQLLPNKVIDIYQQIKLKATELVNQLKNSFYNTFSNCNDSSTYM